MGLRGPSQLLTGAVHLADILFAEAPKYLARSIGTSLLRANPHRARRTSDNLLRLVDVLRVEVFHLLHSNLLKLLLGKLRDLVLWLLGTLLDAELLEDETGCRRLLHDEREGAVLVDGHDDRNDVPHHRAGEGVELIDELADVHASRTEGGTDRRSWRRCACLNLQFDDFGDFLGHIARFFVARALYREASLISSPLPARQMKQ